MQGGRGDQTWKHEHPTACQPHAPGVQTSALRLLLSTLDRALCPFRFCQGQPMLKRVIPKVMAGVNICLEGAVMVSLLSCAKADCLYVDPSRREIPPSGPMEGSLLTCLLWRGLDTFAGWMRLSQGVPTCSLHCKRPNTGLVSLRTY